ncbi:hypothetical protein [Patulibacter sp.]|uniref:hypothetical protein n=1 Tax=Patulibacter sp. TaxID=1912859 RepID=UPI002717A36A|nr:hypothetical protein [Patulibacter sp.]MDO9410480.1 hypothetical protein [Patulibacter sp.]
MPVVGWQPNSPAQWSLYGAEAVWLRRRRVEADLPAAACDALLEGIDSPSLVLLAGETNTAVPADLAELLVRALDELGLTPPPGSELAGRVLRYWCWCIVTKRTTPLRGARSIDRLIYESPTPSTVPAFSRMVTSWFGCDPVARIELEGEIRARAAAVLAEPPSRR